MDNNIELKTATNDEADSTVTPSTQEVEPNNVNSETTLSDEELPQAEDLFLGDIITIALAKLDQLYADDKSIPADLISALAKHLAEWGDTPYTPDTPGEFYNSLRDSCGDIYADAIESAEMLINDLEDAGDDFDDNIVEFFDRARATIIATTGIIIDSPDLNQDVPLTLIDLDSDLFDLRVDQQPLEALLESFQVDGQLNPITLRLHPDQSVARFQVVTGHRLLKVGVELGATTVKARIDPRLSDNKAALLYAVKENLIRAQYTPLDMGHIAMRMRKDGFPMTEVRQHLEKGAKTVERYVHLAEMPDFIQDLIRNNEIKADHAEALYQCQRRVPDLDLQEWADRIVNEALTAKELRSELDKAYPTDKAPKPLYRNNGEQLTINFTIDLDELGEEKMEKALQILDQLSALLGLPTGADQDPPEEAHEVATI